MFNRYITVAVEEKSVVGRDDEKKIISSLIHSGFKNKTDTSFIRLMEVINMGTPMPSTFRILTDLVAQCAKDVREEKCLTLMMRKHLTEGLHSNTFGTVTE